MIPISPFTSCDQHGYVFNRSSDISSIKLNQDLVVYVSGGVSPYTWSVTGSAFDLAATVTKNKY